AVICTKYVGIWLANIELAKPFSVFCRKGPYSHFHITNDTSYGRIKRVGLMSKLKQNLASNPSKKYTY
ncbi:TPA: hypothetical protein ACYK44_002842, partial [Enterococcus faecium]